MRAVDRGAASRRGSRAAYASRDRRRAHRVVRSPHQSVDRRAHVGELEAPRPAEVGELAREPQAAVPERLDATARVRLVRHAGSPVGGGGCLPHRSSPRAATRGATRASAHRRAHVARKLADAVRRRHRRRRARRVVTRSGATAASASACGPPADQPIDAEPLDVERADGRAPPTRAACAQRTRRAAAVDREQAHAERRLRSSRPDAARAASRRRRAGRRPACRPDRRRRRRSARDDQRRAHAERAMIRDGAPERVSPGRELHRQVGRARPAATTPSPAMCRAPMRCTPQVVRILAEVRELDHRRARLEMRAGERERVLAWRPPAPATERSARANA